MKTFLNGRTWSVAVGLLASSLPKPALAPAQETGSTNSWPELKYLPLTTVIGHRQPTDQDLFPLGAAESLSLDVARRRATDVAGLLTEFPGAAVVRNGPQTGIAQLRGLSGDRVRVLVDGMSLTPACANHMDPPLHYAAPGTVNHLALMAGITPVSYGGDSIGGTILADSTRIEFAKEVHQPNLTLTGTSYYRSSNDGYGVSGEAGIADTRFGALYSGSWDTADDLRFPGGRVHDTGYDTTAHAVQLATRAGGMGTWTLDGGLQRTQDAGTPSLPMDMIDDNQGRAGANYRHEGDWGYLSGRVYFSRIDHLMDNYTLRSVAPGMARMLSDAWSEDLGLRLGPDLDLGEGHRLRFGTDLHFNTSDAYQQNLANGLTQTVLNEADRNRVGTYVEWQAGWSDAWSTQVGVRNDTVWMDTGDVLSSFPPATADRNQFNALDHAKTDVNWDVTATARWKTAEWNTLELGFARKNRAPRLLERYQWTPINASAGAADGRTYLGNLDLEPETSHQVALTADFHGPKWQVKVTPFYNWVSDYIQGTPIARLDASGRPVLEYNNLDRADLYGVDGTAVYRFIDALAVRGTLSYVRGINRDNDDHLYRIAPLNGTIAIEHRWKGWENTIEVRMAATQDEVSAYNGETPTSGYGILNLHTAYNFKQHARIDVGLENVLDHYYSDHLGGVNRVLNSDVPANGKIPEAGRFLYVSLRLTY